jgi:hypothetical protein
MSNQNLTEQLEVATQQFMANSPSAEVPIHGCHFRNSERFCLI